ncbi:hypothetical protein MNBD_ALPHA11-1682 [hydrothermal vent metagenome]|uniref:SPOR domain-containing protein n=1 Tax=hydrothermal vent metagenome TaxID=652676 RepID=A0A3B0T8Z1_9ZZZZ
MGNILTEESQQQNQYDPEQADLTFWGVSALIAVGIAAISGSVSTFVPDGFFGGLHASRVQGGTFNQLRSQIAQLQTEQNILLQRANEMRAQFSLSERDRSAVNQRVGALETSIPMLLEIVPERMDIDRLSITASIGDNEDENFIAEGGNVEISRTPLFGASVPLGELMQPVPPPLLGADENMPADGAPPLEMQLGDEQVMQSGDGAEPAQMPGQTQDENMELDQAIANLPIVDTQWSEVNVSQTMFAIAVGETVSFENADALWQEISQNIGALLIGLKPAISDPFQNENFHLVLGPISNYSEAETLCRRIDRVGINCLPVQYEEQN